MTDFMGIPIEVWQELIAALLAIYGYWKTKQVQVLTTPTTNSSLVQSVIVPTLPKSSWTMTDEMKHDMTFDCPAAVTADVLRQVDEAEKAHKLKYTITFPGGYYLVQYGVQYGASGNCNGK